MYKAIYLLTAVFTVFALGFLCGTTQPQAIADSWFYGDSSGNSGTATQLYQGGPIQYGNSNGTMGTIVPSPYNAPSTGHNPC